MQMHLIAAAQRYFCAGSLRLQYWLNLTPVIVVDLFAIARDTKENLRNFLRNVELFQISLHFFSNQKYDKLIACYHPNFKTLFP